jgi:hypothetical protein
MFLQTALTEHLSTAVDLLWVSGHTQADHTDEVIRRGLHKLVIIALRVSNIGCHDVVYVTVNSDHVIPLLVALFGANSEGLALGNTPVNHPTILYSLSEFLASA